VLGGIAEKFLEDYDGTALHWTRPPGGPAGFSTDRVFFGRGENALEVALGFMTRAGKPPVRELRALLANRQANRASPVVLVVLYRKSGSPARAAVVSTGDERPRDMTPGQADRICRAALDEPDRHAAARTAQRLLSSPDASVSPGLSNRGLFASHELSHGVPTRRDWEPARQAALPLLGARGRQLVSRLGYEIRPQGSAGAVLTHNGRPVAAAVIIQETEVFDRPSSRFGGVSPVAYGLMLADHERLPWLIAVCGARIRLYPASPDVGIGRRGQAGTYAEIDLAVLSEEESGYLGLLFSPQALVPGGTVEEILRASQDFAADLGKRLRRRVYRDVMPGLALAVARRQNPKSPAELSDAYRQALLILFRVLFLAYAEDCGLLPYGRNAAYQRHAIKTLAREFAANPTMTFDGRAANHWSDLQGLWDAVDHGNSGWGVPPYNGGLFASDPAGHPLAAALSEVTLTDAELGPCLRALLVDAGEDGDDGPVDFRSLGVHEFSVIYEGLIDFELAISEVSLRRNADGSYVPARPGERADVPAGQSFVRGKSGRRKATGTYFTKPFIVEHLLDTALEPALASHLARVGNLLGRGDEAAAAAAFYDFRVADPAMGSGHFLVAAIDRIEARFSAFLAEHPIPRVSGQLDELAETARARLAELSVAADVEPGALLRRQIARRCVYGIDVSETAWELARLAVWIHTCVPGLPLPTLNLVVANSLTGVASAWEALETLEPQPHPGQASLFSEEIRAALSAADGRLARAARAAEATRDEVKQTAEAATAAARDAGPARVLLDAALGTQLGVIPRPAGLEQALQAADSDAVQEKIRELQAAHMPCLFPRVFAGENPGFDVLIGNPPWEKVKVEEPQWWGTRFPGLMSLPQKEKNAAIARYRNERPDLCAEYETEQQRVKSLKESLGKGNFPGLRSATDTDLSLAFAWRFWHLLRQDGRAGVVLPREVLAGHAGVQWRETILEHGAFSDVTTLVNSRNWVFADVHPQYTLGLVSFVKGTVHAGRVSMQGPYRSRDEYDQGRTAPSRQIAAGDFSRWADGAPFPLLPSADSLDIFTKLRSHPRLDRTGADWQFLPLRELHTTDNKAMLDFDLGNPGGDLPVLTGASFSLWDPGHGRPYAYARAGEVTAWLHERRLRQVRRTSSAFYGMPRDWAADAATLPCLHPRIAFRDLARATDSRTVICCLVPGNVALVHTAPYLLRRKGDAAAEAYVLGILSSIPLDWYARRYVEMHLTAGLLAAFPVPRAAADDPRRRRVAEISARLAAVDERYTAWAAEAGVTAGSASDPAVKDDLTAEIDALASRLYGLRRSDVEHIFTTFHHGWDYRQRLTAVLAHYDRWDDARQPAKAS
jgi:hypothetical protein